MILQNQTKVNIWFFCDKTFKYALNDTKKEQLIAPFCCKLNFKTTQIIDCLVLVHLALRLKAF